MNRKPKGKEFRGVCNHCDKRGHEEKYCWKKHPELIPAKFAKSGAEILDKILVTSVVGLKFSAGTEHVFRFGSENFTRPCANVVDLESFMDSGDNLNNVFLV